GTRRLAGCAPRRAQPPWRALERLLDDGLALVVGEDRVELVPLIAVSVHVGVVDLASLDVVVRDGRREQDVPGDCQAALERLLAWANAFTASLSNVSPTFFEDLH